MDDSSSNLGLMGGAIETGLVLGIGMSTTQGDDD